jgi:hypothetical protein
VRRAGRAGPSAACGICGSRAARGGCWATLRGRPGWEQRAGGCQQGGGGTRVARLGQIRPPATEGSGLDGDRAMKTSAAWRARRESGDYPSQRLGGTSGAERGVRVMGGVERALDGVGRHDRTSGYGRRAGRRAVSLERQEAGPADWAEACQASGDGIVSWRRIASPRGRAGSGRGESGAKGYGERRAGGGRAVGGRDGAAAATRPAGRRGQSRGSRCGAERRGLSMYANPDST